MGEDVFLEKQRFNQWWLWLIILGSTLGPIGMVLLEANSMVTVDEVPSTGVFYGFVIPFMALILLLFVAAQLQTKIDSQGIQVKFFPFHLKWRKYSWEEIEHIQVRNYQPLFEYGGWGIRGFGDNKAFNVSGKTGIQIHFKNGKRLLIGTRKSEEVNLIIAKLFVKEERA
jgi:hypothetical protein